MTGEYNFEDMFKAEIMAERDKAFEKGKDSICQDCKNNAGFNGEFYNCEKPNNVRVKYERDNALFYAKIIKCSGFDKLKGVVASSWRRLGIRIFIEITYPFVRLQREKKIREMKEDKNAKERKSF